MVVDMSELTRPVAIITGASRGIGKAITFELAKLGHDVAIVYRTSVEKARQVAHMVQEFDVKAAVFQADISNPLHRDRLLEEIHSIFGRCDMLVNNAGVTPSQRVDMLRADEVSYDMVMNINLKGPFFLTQAVAGWMIEQQNTEPQSMFRIVNIGSISAYTSTPTRGEYCLSKAGIAMMTKLYADRLAEYNIRVFEIRPGIMTTNNGQHAGDKHDKLIEGGITPIKRKGTGLDVAKAIGAIAMGSLDYCTGQVINVDGGFHLRRI